jgi:predicted MFS family arabinose efflux permease
MTPSPSDQSVRGLRPIILVMALTCGFTVANIYYAQPLLEPIARQFSVSQGTAALVVTLTQLGYALGMVVLLPLGDKVENRRLASVTLLGTAVALAVASFAPTFQLFLVMSVLVGLTSVVVQVIVPIAAHLAPEGKAGSVVGQVMMGLLLGIMLARSLASFVADVWGWQAIFLISAVVMVALSALVWRVLPRRVPENPPSYRTLMSSIGRLVVTESALRRRAACQALLFGAFTAFWTCVAFELIAQFGMTQTGIGLFALVGAAGALAAPIAGRIADRGKGHLGSGSALALAAIALLIAAFCASQLLLLALAAVLLDFAIQTHQVLSQHEIYALQPKARSRVNTVFMASIFVGGAISSAVAGVLHDWVGWQGVCLFGVALILVAFGIWLAHHIALSRRVRGVDSDASGSRAETAA